MHCRGAQIVAPSAPASAVDDDAESSADWRANAKPVAVQDPVVIQSLAGLDAGQILNVLNLVDFKSNFE